MCEKWWQVRRQEFSSWLPQTVSCSEPCVTSTPLISTPFVMWLYLLPIKAWCLLPHPLNLGWLCDLIWLTEYSRRNSMQVQNLGLRKPCHLSLTIKQAQSGLLEEERPLAAEEVSHLFLPKIPEVWQNQLKLESHLADLQLNLDAWVSPTRPAWPSEALASSAKRNG